MIRKVAASELVVTLRAWRRPLALYVHTKGADWILLPDGSMLTVTPQVFADFLYANANELPVLEIWPTA